MSVMVYALSTCPYCKMTRKFLDDNDIEYDVLEVDLLEGDERQAAIEDVKEISGGTSFPVIIINDEVIVGYNKSKIAELLGL